MQTSLKHNAIAIAILLVSSLPLTAAEQNGQHDMLPELPQQIQQDLQQQLQHQFEMLKQSTQQQIKQLLQQFLQLLVTNHH